ncbi:hypothetical protein M405DRAFT_935701 [Rhizopogon salebrosus TDB-379]|nr:hypothetical protein M405DRAFT_935701 [Rhizopogon salebrosus TDB-379]
MAIAHNVFDQRWLDHELLEKYEVHVTRQTLAELAISPSQTTPQRTKSSGYLRASYTPSEFPAPRTTTPLAGGSKVREAFARPAYSNTSWDSQQEHPWYLDANSDLPNSGQEGEPSWTRLARITAQLLMLKPQREGGGLNVYREASPAFLDSLHAEEREVWIAMEMIETLREVGIQTWCNENWVGL